MQKWTDLHGGQSVLLLALIDNIVLKSIKKPCHPEGGEAESRDLGTDLTICRNVSA